MGLMVAKRASRRRYRCSARRRYRSIQISIWVRTSVSRRTGRGCGPGGRLTSPASSRTRRCLYTACSVIWYGSASWPTVASPSASLVTMLRRVGSARAEKTRDSVSAVNCFLVSTCWLKRIYSAHWRTVNRVVETARERAASSRSFRSRDAPSALEMPPLLELPRRIFGDGLPFGHRAGRSGPVDLRQGVIDSVADLNVNGDPVRPADIDAVAVEAVCIGVIDGVTLGATVGEGAHGAADWQGTGRARTLVLPQRCRAA